MRLRLVSPPWLLVTPWSKWSCLFVSAGMELVMPIREGTTFVNDMLRVLNTKGGSCRCQAFVPPRASAARWGVSTCKFANSMNSHEFLTAMPDGTVARWTPAAWADVIKGWDILMASAACEVLITKIAEGVKYWESEADASLAPPRIDLRRRLMQNPTYKPLARLARVALAMIKRAPASDSQKCSANV